MAGYREGGWGWVVVLAGFISQFIVYGNMKALGVLLPHMKETFDSQVWIIGSINTLHFGVQFAFAPLIAAVVRKAGLRLGIVTGGVLYGLGFIMSSLSDDIIFMAAALVLIAGIGAACVVQTTYAGLSFWFQDNYAIAAMVVFIGDPLGQVCCGPLTQLLVDMYGWRGAMLLLGVTGLNLVAVGLLVRRPNNSSYDRVSYQEIRTVESTAQESTQRKLARSCVSTLGLEVFCNLDFLLLSLSDMMYCIVYAGVVVYMVSNALQVGLSANQAALLTTAWGAGNIAGLVLSVAVIHSTSVPNNVMIAVSTTMGSVCLALDPYITNFAGQMGVTFCIGVCVDCVFEYICVMTRNLPFGDDQMTTVFGWQNFLSGVASSLGGVISGRLYESTGSFHAPFLMFGVCTIAIIGCDVLRSVRVSKCCQKVAHYNN